MFWMAGRPPSFGGEKRRKNFLFRWAMSIAPTKLMAQHKKVFLLLFVHKKKPSLSLACRRRSMRRLKP
jgi:hypothetical protein